MPSITLELIAQSKAESNLPLNVIDLNMIFHVHARLERFRYLDNLKSDAIGLDYIEGKVLESDKSILSLDKSFTLASNAEDKIDSFANIKKVVGQSFSAKYPKHDITNKAVINSDNQEIPLWRKHVLPDETIDVQLEIIENFTDPLEEGWLVSLDDNCIYTNYRNYYDFETGRYRIYVLTCTSSSGEQTKQLLSPVSTVSEATWNDIDLDTGVIKTGRTVYTVEQNNSTWDYYISAIDTYWIKPARSSRLYGKMPANLLSNENWYLELNNGSVTQTVNNKVLHYWIPEYYLQSFVPEFPIMYANNIEARWVNSRCIKLPHNQVKINADEYKHLLIRVYDYQGNLINLWTTDPAMKDKYYSDTGVKYSTDRMIGWDLTDGFVYFNTSILPSWQYRVDYFYSSENYVLNQVNLNPILNKEMQRHMLVVYCVPNCISTDLAIHWLLVDQHGIIKKCSQSGGYSYPNLQLYNTDGSINQNTVINMKYYSEVEDCFMSTYGLNFSNDYQYMILNELVLKERDPISSLRIQDVRMQGGKPLFKSDVYAKNPNSLLSTKGYQEDGYHLPLNSVVVVDIPYNRIVDEENNVSKNRYEDLARKLVPLNSTVITQFNYPWPDVTYQLSSTEEVNLAITWEGPQYLYNVYRSDGLEKEYVLLESIEAPTRGEIVFTDTAVESGSKYYYRVRLQENDIEYPAKFTLQVEVR